MWLSLFNILEIKSWIIRDIYLNSWLKAITLQHVHGCQFLAYHIAWKHGYSKFVHIFSILFRYSWGCCRICCVARPRPFMCLCSKKRFRRSPINWFDSCTGNILLGLTIQFIFFFSFPFGFVMLLLPVTAASANHSWADYSSYIPSCLISLFRWLLHDWVHFEWLYILIYLAHHEWAKNVASHTCMLLVSWYSLVCFLFGWSCINYDSGTPKTCGFISSSHVHNGSL